MSPTYHNPKSPFDIFKIVGIGSALRAVFGWIMAALGLYMIAAIVGALITQNSNYPRQETGRTIYIYDNGVHTSLVLSRSSNDVDLGETITKNTEFPGSSATYPWIMVGWGDRDFFLNTPQWKDLRPRTAVSALWGSGASLIHIDRLKALPPSDSLREITLSDDQYAKLLQFILPQISIGPNSRPIAMNGYGLDDRFYASAGREYWALYTCNNWIGEAIGLAGVKTGIWTPLPFGIMWWK